MSAAVVMPAAAAAPSPVHHNRPSRANVAAKTFQCTECSAVLISPTEFQLHIENRHMNDSTNDEDSDVDAVTEDDFGKVSENCFYRQTVHTLFFIRDTVKFRLCLSLRIL